MTVAIALPGKRGAARRWQISDEDRVGQQPVEQPANDVFVERLAHGLVHREDRVGDIADVAMNCDGGTERRCRRIIGRVLMR